VFGQTSKIYDTSLAYNVGFVANLEQARLNTFWDSPATTTLVAMNPPPVTASISDPSLVPTALTVDDTFDAEEQKFLTKSEWTEDVCPDPIQISLGDQECLYWDVIAEYGPFMRNATDQPELGDCSNLESFQFTSFYEKHRTACFPSKVETNVLQSEQPYDDKTKKYFVNIDSTNHMASVTQKLDSTLAG